MYKEIISDYIDGKKDEMIKTLSWLVEVPSVKSEPKAGMPYGENVFEVFKRIFNISSDMGFTTENFENRVCVASIDNSEKNLGILCHLDVVDVNVKNWDTLPFELTYKDNMIYCRGAYDNKGAAVAALYALCAVKDLKIPLKHGVGVYFGTDEESGGSDMDAYIEKHTLPKHIFTPDSQFPVCVSERGVVRIKGVTKFESDKIVFAHSGEQVNVIPDEAVVRLKNTSVQVVENILLKMEGIRYEISEKDSFLNVRIYGKSSHAAYPEGGSNAAVALLYLLSVLDGGAFGKLSDLFGVNMFYGEGFGFSKERLTLSLTVLDYVDGELEIKADSRIASGESSASAAKVFAEKIPFTVTADTVVEPHDVSENEYIVTTLMDIYREHTGGDEKPYKMSGITYAHKIKNAVVFGPRIQGDGSGGAHSANERFNVNTMLTAAKMFAAAMVKICNE